MPDSPLDTPKAAKQSPKSRMWVGLLGASMLIDLAYFAIAQHELMGRIVIKVTPLTGAVWGGAEIAAALYLLTVVAWGGYRDLRAERKDKSATQD